jgi:hypothetical protein
MAMNGINEAIAKLRTLDLSVYPVNDINALFKLFGKVAAIEYNFHPGKKIIRARPEDDQWPYVTRSAHSYKPQQFNKAYQRAITPDRTMFMGALFPKSLIRVIWIMKGSLLLRKLCLG